MYSIFLAQIIGPIYVVVALSFLLGRQDYKKIVNDFLGNAGMVYLGGAIALMVGLLIVNTHNLWESKWFIIITLMGWMAIIKGICYFIFPEQIKKLADKLCKNEKGLKIQLIIVLLFGLFITYKGYF